MLRRLPHLRAAHTVAALVAAGGVLCGLSAAAYASAPSPPTTAQIHSAVQAAKRSRNLWATVNACGSTGTSRAFGIRGQMPGLSFTTSMYMTFVVYYRTAQGGTQVVAGTRETVLAARGSNRLYQAGVTFQFSPPTTLSGKVKFVWKRGGRQLGDAIRWTTANHHRVDSASPPHYSASLCTLS